MDMGLQGRTALLTGASRGMGRACAEALAREGVDLTLVARGSGPLEETAAAIRAASGVRVTTVAADISTEAGRAAALAACPDPDILLANAGGMKPGDFRQWSREDWIAAVDLMMLPPILLTRAVVDGMMARGFGRIVAIAARTVKCPQPELGLSNGARSGLVGFLAGLGRQTVRHNVTINTLLPGIIASEAQREHVDVLAQHDPQRFKEIWAARAAENPAGRYGRPEEIGAAFCFLCSAHAGFITGQSLMIDGGSYPGTF